MSATCFSPRYLVLLGGGLLWTFSAVTSAVSAEVERCSRVVPSVSEGDSRVAEDLVYESLLSLPPAERLRCAGALLQALASICESHQGADDIWRCGRRFAESLDAAEVERDTQWELGWGVFSKMAERYAQARRYDEEAHALGLMREAAEASPLSVQDLLWGDLLLRTGDNYRARHLDADAEQAYSEALRLSRLQASASSLDVIIPLSKLSKLYLETNRFEGAANYLDIAISIIQEKDGNESLALVSVLTDYARVMSALGRTDEAEHARSRASRIESKHSSDPGTSTAHDVDVPD